jgi:hypothetical protein
LAAAAACGLLTVTQLGLNFSVPRKIKKKTEIVNSFLFIIQMTTRRSPPFLSRKKREGTMQETWPFLHKNTLPISVKGK